MDDHNEINTTRMYRRGMNEKKKIPLVYWIIGIVVVAILLLIWAEFGVGIFGTPWAGS